MRKLRLFSAVLSLFLLVPASIIWAQTITSQKGLTTIEFILPTGVIKLYLPQDIRPGDMISGSVKLEPSGNTERERQRSLDDLLKRELKIGDPNDPKQVAQSLLRRYQQDPRAAAIGMEPVSLPFLSSVQVLNGTKPEFTTPLKTARPGPVNDPGDPACTWPSHVMLGTPLPIKGQFDGDLQNTKCSIGGQPATVLAESPRASFVQMPENLKGPQPLQLTEKNKPLCTGNILGVDLQVTAGRLQLKKGEQTFVDVRITGLQQLPAPAVLTVTNLSSTVVTMLPSNMVIKELRPDSVGSGIYEQRYDIRSLRTGNFNVNVNLDLPGEENRESAGWFDMRDLKNESGYPGSYGYKGDQPCEPEGATIKWRWHKTFACEISERKVLPCGHTKEGNDVYEKLKELLEEAEMDKATDIGEKMAKAFSTAKTFTYSIHVIRKWVDYDIEYKCVNGKWSPVGGVYVKHGTDDLGWHSVKHPSTECWMTFDSPAAEKEFEAALEHALRSACK